MDPKKLLEQIKVCAQQDLIAYVGSRVFLGMVETTSVQKAVIRFDTPDRSRCWLCRTRPDEVLPTYVTYAVPHTRLTVHIVSNGSNRDTTLMLFDLLLHLYLITEDMYISELRARDIVQ